MAENSNKGKGLGVGIDLGTSNLLVYVEGVGTVFNEPSVIAIDRNSKKVISIGKEASELVGRVHDKVEVIKPLQGGVISDIEMIRSMLSFTLNRVQESQREKITKLLICVPSEITPTERDAIRQLGIEVMGEGNECIIEEEVKAAAIGGGLNIYTPMGRMVIDIGGGTTDIGVLSLGEVVLSKTVKVAGDYFDSQIARHLKEKHSLEIGIQTAEQIKHTLATLGDIPVDEQGNEIVFTASGRDLIEGLPNEKGITATEIKEVMLKCFEHIKSLLISTLEVTPPELSGDLVDTGILVSGGGALIPGIKEYFEEISQVPVKISEVPLTAVVDGTKKLLKISGRHFIGDAD